MLLALLLMASFIVRVINLNYNSPFNDEAIYIVVGKLGIFQRDWWSYNATSWMAGYPYIYPAFAALSSVTGGIVGARMLNVIFGVLAIETTYKIASMLAKPSRSVLAGIIAATIMAASSVSIYVSRLATYDMPSFYFLLLSILFLLLAQKKDENPGKWYFLSAVTLILSFFTKIVVGVYIPGMIIYSYLVARSIGKQKLFFWKRYFSIPILVVIATYILTNLSSIRTYFNTQTAREQATFMDLVQNIANYTYLIWGLLALGILGLILKKEFKKLAILSTCSLLILSIHFYMHRLATLDKHIYLFLFFSSLIAGLGISNIADFIIKKVKVKAFLYSGLTIVMLVFATASYIEAQRFNDLWSNNYNLLNYLSENEQPGDKVLVESGAAPILATYDKNFPTNTSTFDYFKYGQLEGEEAYRKAVKDGYFDLIQLEENTHAKSSNVSNMHTMVAENISSSYQLAYSKDGFLVYRRKF
jgi:4-amino-4-deoxy-L-arabinose transferase-like glycosyltransferase